MKKIVKVKRIFTILLIFLLSINSFATSLGDNDGSAFITKAEFDSLKNNFQTQLDAYNTGIDSKIDAAIASYLAGISISKEIALNSLYSNYKIKGCGNSLWWTSKTDYCVNSGDTTSTPAKDEQYMDFKVQVAGIGGWYNASTTQPNTSVLKYGTTWDWDTTSGTYKQPQQKRVLVNSDGKIRGVFYKSYLLEGYVHHFDIQAGIAYWYMDAYGPNSAKYKYYYDTTTSTWKTKPLSRQGDMVFDCTWGGTGGKTEKNHLAYNSFAYSEVETDVGDGEYLLAPCTSDAIEFCDLDSKEYNCSTYKTIKLYDLGKSWYPAGKAADLASCGAITGWGKGSVAYSATRYDVYMDIRVNMFENKCIADMEFQDFYAVSARNKALKTGLVIHEKIPKDGTYTAKIKTSCAGTIYLYSSNTAKLYNTLSADNKFVYSTGMEKTLTINDVKKDDDIRILFVPNNPSGGDKGQILSITDCKVISED